MQEPLNVFLSLTVKWIVLKTSHNQAKHLRQQSLWQNGYPAALPIFNLSSDRALVNVRDDLLGACKKLCSLTPRSRCNPIIKNKIKAVLKLLIMQF